MTRFERIADIAGADDWAHDPFGTSMSMFFDVCEVLDAADVEGDVTPEWFREWGYGRGLGTVPAVETIAARADGFAEGEWADDYSYGTVALAYALVSGDIGIADLIYAGRVLNGYVAVVKAYGRDY